MRPDRYHGGVRVRRDRLLCGLARLGRKLMLAWPLILSYPVMRVDARRGSGASFCVFRHDEGVVTMMSRAWRVGAWRHAMAIVAVIATLPAKSAGGSPFRIYRVS
jgi:hypothetical protein